MSMYLCMECDRLLDGDYFPPSEHPKDDMAFICDDCMAELETPMADFQQGVMDCDRGIRHKEGQSKAYDRGYGFQYEKEQRITEQTK